MRVGGARTERVLEGVNRWVSGLRTSPRWGRFVRKHFTVITYTGRRSGRTFTTPVGYRRTGDTVTIRVLIPDAKNWWRNFTGDGGPITLQLDEADRPGHATAHRDEKGRVAVTVRLAD